MNLSAINKVKIGILGGGQLGKMLIQAGSPWNLDFHILDPNKSCPASLVCSNVVEGNFNDYNDVMSFGKDKDLLTIEIENVNVEALRELQKMGKTVYPDPTVISTIKDKGFQKTFYKDNAIPTSDFFLVQSESEIQDKVKEGNLTFPFVQKVRTEGYDGRGVLVVKSENDLDNLLNGPSVVEEAIDIEKELAVLVCRSLEGQVSTFEPVEMVFDEKANLVDYLISPARIADEQIQEARNLALQVSEAFETAGIMAVEMFLTKQGEIIVNEVAPRPHNSGHQTIEGNITSQYEQHLRSILGLSLGNTDHTSITAMVNILGAEGYSGEAKVNGIQEVMKIEGAHIHLYGKSHTKPFRKMGHVTIEGNNAEDVLSKAERIKDTIEVVA